MIFPIGLWFQDKVLMLSKLKMISKGGLETLCSWNTFHPPWKVSTATLSGYLRFLAIGVFKKSFSVRGGQVPLCWVLIWGRMTAIFGIFLQTGGKSSVCFSQFLSNELCRFPAFWWDSVKLFWWKLHQSEVYQKINPTYFTVNFTWVRGEFNASSPREPFGPFHSECPSLPYKRLSLCKVVLRLREPRAVSVFQSSSSLQ